MNFTDFHLPLQNFMSTTSIIIRSTNNVSRQEFATEPQKLRIAQLGPQIFLHRVSYYKSWPLCNYIMHKILVEKLW